MWEEEDGQQRYTSCPTACRCEVRDVPDHGAKTVCRIALTLPQSTKHASSPMWNDSAHHSSIRLRAFHLPAQRNVARRFPEQSMHDLSTPLASRLHARIDLTPFPIGTRLRHLRRAKADRYSLHGVLALLWPHAERMRWLGASAAHGSALQPLRWAARGRGLPALPRRARRARGRATAARGGAAAAGRGRGASPMAGHAHRAAP